MSLAPRRVLQSALAGVGAIALVGAGALSASADYTVPGDEVTTSPAAPWTVSSAEGVRVASYEFYGYEFLGLQFTPGAGETLRATHEFASGSFPRIDALAGQLVDPSFLTTGNGTFDLDPTSPMSAWFTNTGSGDATVSLLATFAYGDDEDSLTNTMTWECAFDVPAGQSGNPDLTVCDGSGDAMDWTVSGDWDFTYYPYYPMSRNGAQPVTYAAGDHVVSGKLPAVVDLTGFGFQVSSAQGTTLVVDDLFVRGEYLRFDAAATTTSVSATTSGPATPGSPVTVTATVAPAHASGMVTILDGTDVVGSGPVVDGVFRATIASPTEGDHTLSAEFASSDLAFQDSGSATLTLGVHTKAAPAPAPAGDTEALLADPDHAVGPTSALAPAGGADPAALDPTVPLTASVDWADPTDTFVDVYLYSTPTFVGTFPVVNGQVQLSGVILSSLTGSAHHMALVGQSSGNVVVIPFALGAARLAAAGVEPAVPFVAAGGLLLLGAAALLAARRTRRVGATRGPS